MNLFPSGTKVETNKSYFEKFGRKVIGESVALEGLPLGSMTAVRWLYQEGKVIPDHQDQIVIMMSEDLQKCVQN